MKRSTMVDNIYRILKDNLDIKYLDVPYEFVADQILSTVEECGMKPPVNHKCPVLLRETNEWEAE